eukprot:s4449_g5.t1
MDFTTLQLPRTVQGKVHSTRNVWRAHCSLAHRASLAFGDIDLPLMWQAWRLVTSTSILCGRRGWQAWHLVTWTFTFVWQAWHLVTSTFVLCGKRGTCGTQMDLVARLVPADAAAFCVAGVALGDIDLHFLWQAWHLATSTFVLCGRRGTCGTQMDLVTRLVPADAAAFCVTGVAFGDIDLHLVWQAWHLATSTFILCGRRGTCGTQLDLVTSLVLADAAAFFVAGVALGDIHLRFVWQAWHLVTWTFVLCGKRGAW